MSTTKNKKNKELDMLSGSIWDKLPRFALPVAATAILQQLFNASDIVVVGNFTGDLGTAAVAAVGANSPIINLIVSLFMGMALGVNVVIATAIGQKNSIDVEKAVHTAVTVALLGGLLVAILGEIIAAPILRLISVPDEVFDMSLLYLRIYLVGMPVILLYNFEAAIFRSVGDTRLPLIALASSGVINVILNIFFVVALHMTVNGVAIATVVSNAISSSILYRELRTTDLEIHLDPRKLTIDKRSLRWIVRIGIPAGIQGSVFAVSNILIQSAINSLGTIVMAASSAAANIEGISYFLLNSFSQACTTFTGQNVGAGKFDRCRKILFLSLLEGAIAMSISIVVTLIFGRQLLAIFDNDSQVIILGYTRLVVILFSNCFSLLYEVMTGYMRGFGISLAPALITTVVICGIRIFWVQLVFPSSTTFGTLMTVYPVSNGITTFLVGCSLLKYMPSKKHGSRRVRRAL